MSLYKSTYKCRAALPKGINPLPIFRDKDVNLHVNIDENIEDEYRLNLGKNCGKRVYPYTDQDIYDRELKECEIESIVLENEYLKAIFLPTLGGRLISLFDKENDRQLLFDSKNIQSCNLAIRNAWFSGGIEFNIGQYGHSLVTMDDVHSSAVEDGDEGHFLRIGEYEKMHEIYWHIDFHLPEGSKFLYMKCEISNLDDEIKSTYAWINTALIQDDRTRVFASNKNALFLDPFMQQREKGYTKITLPDIESFKNIDASYPSNFPFSNEYFFTCDKDTIPYEVTVDKNGNGFMDFSTRTLQSRKMFCWESQNGGKRWQEYLNRDEKLQYFEAQSGISTTQLHGFYLKPHETVSFTQAFGAIKIDESSAQNIDHSAADEAVHKRVNSLLSDFDIDEIDSILSEKCKLSKATSLHDGSMFSKLDAKIKNIEIPAAYRFLTEGYNNAESVFEDMIERRYTYCRSLFDNYVFPPNCFDELLSNYDDAYSLYLRAIISAERFEFDGAIELLKKAEKEETHCLISRALAQLHLKNGDIEMRDEYYERAIDECTKEIELIAISSEYSKILRVNEEFGKERVLINKLDLLINKFEGASSISDICDSIALDKGVMAAHFGNIEELQHCLFDRELSCIKEGDNPFLYLFNEYMALKLAKKRGVEIDDDLRAEANKLHPIPHALDFTMEAK